MNSITKNAVGLFMIQMVVKVLSTLWTFYLARRLGVAGYGLWANILALTAIFGVLQGFGILSLVVKDVSQDNKKSREYFGASLTIYCVSSAVCFLLVIISGLVLKYPSEKMILLALAAGTYLVYAPALASQSILYGHEKFLYFNIASTCATVLYIALGISAVELGWGVKGVFMALCAQYAVLSVFLFRSAVKRYGSPILEGATQLGVRLAKFGIPLVLSSVLVELMLRSDRILIEKYLGETSLGLYHAAFNLIFLPREAFLIPLVTVIYNRLCATYIHDRAEFVRVFHKANSILLILIIPMTGIFICCADPLIRFFYGAKFIGAEKILRLLAGIIAPLFFVSLWQNIYIMQNRTHRILMISLIGAACNILLNLIFLSHFGSIESSAAVAVATQFILLFVILWDLRKEHPFHFNGKGAKILLSGLLVFLPMYFLRSPSRFFLWISLSAGTAAYGLLLFLFKIFDEEELAWIRDSLAQWRKVEIRKGLK